MKTNNSKAQNESGKLQMHNRGEFLQFLDDDQKAWIAFMEDSLEEGEVLDIMIYPPCSGMSNLNYSLNNNAQW